MRLKPPSLAVVSTVALAALLVLPFAGCSKKEPEASSGAPPQPAAEAPAASPAEAPPAQAPEAKPQEAKKHAKSGSKKNGKKQAKNGTQSATKGAAKSGAATGGGTESTHALGLRVQYELLKKLGADSLHVDVAAEGGKVVLSGKVEQRATAELAEDVAEKVAGVTSVENRLEVAATPASGSKVDAAVAETGHELADATLETEVQIALVDKMGTDGLRIDTDAASGVVTLSFPKKMKSARRQAAVELAKKVKGVTKVVSLEKS